jgi:hypothetical protein
VGLVDRFRGLFGSAPRSGSKDRGIYVRVRCDACGEIIQARVNPTAELSQLDDDEGYFLRKVLVGTKCYRPIEVELHYSDLRGTEISREVRGGKSVE